MGNSMNSVEKIIELYERAKKADDYKSQLDTIYRICRERQTDIMSAVSRGNVSKIVIETVVKGNPEYKLINSILQEINL